MINILFTCSGGKFVYDLVSSLKSQKDLKIKFIGVDVNDNFNQFFLDKFYKVPRADINSNVYLKTILKICLKEKIKIIFPLSENESRLFSKNIEKFKKKNIQIPISQFSSVNKIIDKYLMMKHLSEKKIEVGNFFKIDNIDDLDNTLKSLGFPKKKIILKPRNSSGSRGIFVINEKIKMFNNLLVDRLCGEGNYKSVVSIIKNNLGSLNDYLAMPYYEGPTYDVDCFTKNGKVLDYLARLRIYKNPFSPTNEGCVPIKNKKILKYIERIVKAFDLNGCCDFDIIMIKNNPRVIDISGRLSGSIGAGVLSGVNILANSIRVMKGKKKKNYKLKENLNIYPVSKFVIK